MTVSNRTQWCFMLSLASALAACGGRTSTQEVGGKTSWLSTCGRDADCGFLEGAVCVQQLCTVTCERDGCGAIAGTNCVAQNTACLTQSTCLPECIENSDCRRFGSNYTCHASVCVLDACVPSGIETPDGSEPTPAPTTTTNPPLDDTFLSLPQPDAPTSEDGICVLHLDREPEQRPYKSSLEEYGYTSPLQSEPACNGNCGYSYTTNSEDGDGRWEYSSVLQCPLATSRCGELAATLDANPARCNTLDDCLRYTGVLAPCEPFFDQPRYFDSALFTTEQREAREATLREMQQSGCREPFLGWDGPTYLVDCVDNLCSLVESGYCGGAPPVECDACGPDAGESADTSD